jgi:hypothetical protein
VDYISCARFINSVQSKLLQQRAMIYFSAGLPISNYSTGSSKNICPFGFLHPRCTADLPRSSSYRRHLRITSSLIMLRASVASSTPHETKLDEMVKSGDSIVRTLDNIPPAPPPPRMFACTMHISECTPLGLTCSLPTKPGRRRGA